VQLFLASTSPARLATLRSAGIEPIVVHSNVDEDAVVAAAEATSGPLAAQDMVVLLARAKAEAVLNLDSVIEASSAADPDGAHRGILILGGDSAFVLDGVIYGKPHTPEAATARWHAQRGHTGHLYSGHWLIHLVDGKPAPSGVGAGNGVGHVSVAEVTFANDITDAEIDAYVASGEPLKVAGAFTIDSLGSAFIDRIVGDPSTVVGVSVPTVRRLARELDVEWPQLWNR
jgi:septum formation protein